MYGRPESHSHAPPERSGVRKGGIIGSIAAAFMAALLTFAYFMGWIELPQSNEAPPQSSAVQLYSESEMPQSVPPSEPEDKPELRIHIINVGQGDSILIQAPDRTILIDAGEEGYGPTVMGYLDALGVDRIDVMIATHPHSDHIGDMDYVIKHLKKVGVLYLSKIPDSVIPTTRCYENLLQAALDKGVTVKTARIGVSLKLGEDGKLTFVGPVEPFEDYNNNSLVSRIVFGNNAFLFGGDSSVDAEKLLLEKGTDISCDYMHIAHHGSRSSSSDAYLDAVGPKYATISCGKDNSYGHPNKETLEKLKKRRIEYYRTDLDGNIVVTSDGENITITTQK